MSFKSGLEHPILLQNYNHLLKAIENLQIMIPSFSQIKRTEKS